MSAVKKSVETRVQIGCEDMVLLTNFTEEGIVENLTTRLQQSELYTNIGHVLVACNPYKWLDIYNEEWVSKYVHQQRVDVAPHVFATAEAAYRTLVTEEDSQCIIISGESGAGKTEASKQIQTYIAAVCGGGESVEKLKRVFLESNPVLEAFGNAKTLRNNNSSRFGKYFELKFNRFGVPQGGCVTNYLLEKSRIVRPGKGERNFHIFYQLLNSEFCGKLKLSQNANDYASLACSGCSTVDGISDTTEFKITIGAMRNVGISNKQIQSILSLVAAILHLSNVGFQTKDIGDTEGSKIMNTDSLRKFCEFAQIDEATMAHNLIFREMQTAGAQGKMEVYQVPQNPVQAGSRRDAVAKVLYEKLFDLIVERINVALAVSANTAADDISADEMINIGVLDIYGFEIFESNGFEQLCINYVNEKLQQIFIELTLRAEQDEYEQEGIAWKAIPFFNNKIVCDLLDSARPAGVFRILDDTVKTLHGSQDAPAVDRKFLETTTQVHGRHQHFKNISGAFTIKHYAGDVTYNCKGAFVESNKDSLNADLYGVLQASTDKLVQRLFPQLPEVPLGRKAAISTASAKIRSQCNDLVTALMSCQPHYVRCVKSNDQKKALKVDSKRVKHQAQYLGLLENIKVRRAGFAYRAEYHRFLHRFGILSSATYPEWRGSDKDGCRKILSAIAKRIPGLNKEEAQLGKTKVFIRQPESYFSIERLREAQLGNFVSVIQRAWRSYSNSRDFVIMQNDMAKCFSKEGKSRRRDSIFRPYAGDYLDALGAQAEDIRENMFRIIDHYNNKENVVFADADCGQIKNSTSISKDSQVCDGCSLEKKMIVLTDAALYVMDICTNDYFDDHFSKGGATGRALPKVVLRRRILIAKSKGEGCLTSLGLSKMADPCLVLSVNAERQLRAPQVDHFVDDKDPLAKVCAATGTPFSLFARRHHCRLSGRCYMDACTQYTQALPDRGYYHSQRVADAYIGLESTDLCEDMLFACPRRTELVSLISAQWKQNGCTGNIPITFNDRIKLSAGRTGENGGSSHGFFSSAGTLLQPSVLPSDIIFTEKKPRTGNNEKRTISNKVLHLLDINIEKDRQGCFAVCSTPGMSQSVVAERQKRAAARRKRKEEIRHQQNQERQARAAAREAQRDQEHQARLAEKKAKKAAEREARKAAEENALHNESARVEKCKARSRPVDNAMKETGGGAGNELAAALARRKANAKK